MADETAAMKADSQDDPTALDYGAVYEGLMRIWQHLKQHPLPAEDAESGNDSLALAIALVSHLDDLSHRDPEEANDADDPVETIDTPSRA